MRNPKIFIPYLFGLVSLLVSLRIVYHGTGVEAKLLPLIPSPTAPLPRTGIGPQASNQARCRVLSQPRFFFYTPSPSNYVEDRLTITGTVYASDLKPLSDAVIEIRRMDPIQANKSQPLSTRRYVPTDETGYYRFTTVKPDRPEQAYLHLQFAYGEHCPLLLHLHLVTEADPKLAQSPAFAKVVEVTGPMLWGPLDIVLPGSASSR
jgi:protocatechuate 3,4-dioxygenase beta subunit